MQVHHYTEEGQFFLASTDARMSPMEPDVPLVPRFATLIEPPADLENMVRVFVGTGWEYRDVPAQGDAQ